MAVAIFLFARDGPSVYPSVDKAVGSIEAVDVENGEYEIAHDDEGHAYQPAVNGFAVRLVATGTTDRDDLVHRLADFCERVGFNADPTTESFVLEMAHAIAGRAWESRWPKRPRWLSKRVHGQGPPDFSR